MTDVSVIIPVAPYHDELLERAIASCKIQTVPCKVLYMKDTELEGAGIIRNRLINTVDTKYIVFLDADDWLQPDFIEECLRVIRPGRYVYTDWFQDQEHIQAPNRAWCNGTWHVITTMCHTEDVKSVNGFNEGLPALEDTDFWLKLTTRQICGIRIPKPLSHYGKEGRRAHSVHKDGSVNQIKQWILAQYEGMMGCCGQSEDVDVIKPVGEKQPGDVLAMALWRGNRYERGRVTGRRYDRISYPKRTWVAPADIQARPDLWHRVQETVVTEELDINPVGLLGFADFMQTEGMLGKRDATRIDPPQAVLSEEINPNFQFVIDYAKSKLK